MVDTINTLYGPSEQQGRTLTFDLHPNQIKQWKGQLLDGVSDVFDDKPNASREPEIDVKSLHAKIG